MRGFAVSQPLTVSSTHFSRHFAEIRDHIRELGVVRVENHNRLVGGFLSPAELERYEQMKSRERKVYKVGELPDDLVAALEATLKAIDSAE